MNRNYRLLISVSLISIVACGSNLARGQTASGAAATEGSGLEEVTVTARKRSEALLQTPISITAFDSAKIQEEGIYSLTDVSDLTPGFSIDNENSGRNDRSFQTIIIRGMTPSLSPTTSVFIDGAPVSAGFVDGIDDVERVEVLKGPQSAYFGRETFAGAVNIVTKKPTEDFQGNVDVLFGQNNWRDLRATVEGAIIPDKFAARLSIRDYSMDGQYHNTGAPPDNLGDQSTKSVNTELYFTPTDNLSVKVFGLYWHDNDGPPAGFKFAESDYNCNAGGAPKGTLNYICGQLPGFATSRLGANDYVDPLFQRLINNVGDFYTPVFGPDQQVDHGGLSRDAYHLNAAIDYYLPDWGITLSSLTAANMDHYSVIQDLDIQNSLNIPNPYYGIIPNVEPYSNYLAAVGFIRDDVSQEFRVTSDQDGRFRWMGGASYNHTLSEGSLAASFPFGSLNLGGTAPQYTDTYAAFGSLAYDILDNLTVNFEGRYQLDRVALFQRPEQGADEFVASGDYHNFLPRVIVQYKYTPEIMLYASWAQGANPGSFNTQLTAGEDPATVAYVQKTYGIGLKVQPELTQQYELGVKGSFWDGRIHLSTDVYTGTWSNQIANQNIVVPLFGAQGGSNVLTLEANVGKTDLYGWEFDGAIKPIDHLIINGAVGIAATEVKSYQCLTCLPITGYSNAAGKQLPNYPKWQANAEMEYSDELPFLAALNWYARGEWIYRSREFDNFEDVAWTPSSSRFNFRVGVRNAQYSFELFVLNAFNDKAYSSILQNVDVFSPGFSAAAIEGGEPLLRQFGLRARYKFGGPVTESPAAPAVYAPPPVQPPVAAEVPHSYLVFFDFNKSDLTPQAAKIVDLAALNAGLTKVTRLNVTGHTDTVGSDAYNMRLSRRRAESVAAELEAHGISASEIEIIAKGKHDLLVPTADGVREPQNRRVQIVYEDGAAGS
jgi:iron complex outermembrane receptor protein